MQPTKIKNEISNFSLEELKCVKRDLDKQMVKDFTTNVDLIRKLFLKVRNKNIGV